MKHRPEVRPLPPSTAPNRTSRSGRARAGAREEPLKGSMAFVAPDALHPYRAGYGTVLDGFGLPHSAREEARL